MEKFNKNWYFNFTCALYFDTDFFQWCNLICYEKIKWNIVIKFLHNIKPEIT